MSAGAIRVGTVVASLSRHAGGLLGAVSRLCQVVASKSGVEVRVFGLRDDATEADRAAWSGIDVTACMAIGPRAFGYSRELPVALRQDERLDVLHNHGLWMYPSAAVVQWARRSGRPYVISPHGMLDPWALRNSRLKKLLAEVLFERQHWRGAACLHALNEQEYRSIRACGLRNPVCVIPNGVDLPIARPTERPDAWANIPEGKKVLLFLGRIHPKKGLTNLIRAWAELPKVDGSRAADWHLVIAGWDQGGHAAQLKAYVADAGIAQTVSFIGPVFGTEKERCLAHASAFILPSFSEGLPMSVLEAWSYNVPVLMTRECNLSEGFDAGAAVEIPATVAGTAASIGTLFEMSDADRAAIGNRGSALVASSYTWHDAGRKMIETYSWLLGGSPRPDWVAIQ